MDADNPGRKLVRPEGIEPPTFRVEAECSIQLSYGRIDPAFATMILIVKYFTRKSLYNLLELDAVTTN